MQCGADVEGVERERGHNLYSPAVLQRRPSTLFQSTIFTWSTNVHFDNLSGTNKAFLFKGTMVLCFHKSAFLRVYSEMHCYNLAQDTWEDPQPVLVSQVKGR